MGWKRLHSDRLWSIQESRLDGTSQGRMEVAFFVPHSEASPKGTVLCHMASLGVLGQLTLCLAEDGSAAPGVGSYTWHHSGAVRKADPSLMLYAWGTQKQVSASALILF